MNSWVVRAVSSREARNPLQKGDCAYKYRADGSWFLDNPIKTVVFDRVV